MIIKKNSLLQKTDLVFFIFLFSFVFILFRRAFHINFILDDFIFLKLGRASNFNEFLHFFSPFKTYFYRPIPTEIYYLLINLFNKNVFIAHSIVFVSYFIALGFLYKSIVLISNNKLLSRIITTLYAISFVHVFQLYELATFIEVSLFAFCILSFYLYLRKRYCLSLIFYICALFSKETSIFLPLIFILLHVLKIWKIPNNKFAKLVPYILLSIGAFFLYRPSVSYLQKTEPLYALHFNPRLIFNNLMWYSLWSLGLPNFLPDYLTSIFSKPLPKFWDLFKDMEYRVYFYSIAAYYALLIPTAIVLFVSIRKQIKKYFPIILFLTLSFLLFIVPTLPTIHKWMVRLTIPLIFIICAQGLIVYEAFLKKSWWRVISILLVVLYVIIQITGVSIHENSSVYFLQSSISSRMQQYCIAHTDEIRLRTSIYFIDRVDRGLWGGSEMLRNTLHESDFIDAYCPPEVKKAYFNYKQKTIPHNSYVIDSAEIIVQ